MKSALSLILISCLISCLSSAPQGYQSTVDAGYGLGGYNPGSGNNNGGYNGGNSGYNGGNNDYNGGKA